MSERPNPNPQQELSETIRAAAAGEGENPANFQEPIEYSGRVDYQLFDRNGEPFTNDYRTTYDKHGAEIPTNKGNIRLDSELKIVDLNGINRGTQIVENNVSMAVENEFKDGNRVSHQITMDKNRHDGDPVIRTTRVDSEGNPTETFEKMSPRQQRAAARLARISFGIKKDEDPVETEKAA